MSEAQTGEPGGGLSERPGHTYADILAEVGLETEETRDSLLRSRKGSRFELRNFIGSSALAGLVIALETWGVLRGEPFFGWLIPVLFTGFAVYFWSRRRRAQHEVSSLEERLEYLEEEREKLANRDGSRSGSLLTGDSLKGPDGQGIA